VAMARILPHTAAQFGRTEPFWTLFVAKIPLNS